MPTRPSGSERQAIDAAQAVGLPVTPGQLEGWRSAGVIPTAPPTYPGRGSVRVYTDEELRWILDSVRHRRAFPKQPLYELVIWLFIDGYPIDDRKLRSAYSEFFRSIWDELVKASDGDIYDQAEAIAKRIASSRHPGPSVRDHKDAARTARRRRRDRESPVDPVGQDLRSLTASFVVAAAVGEPYALDDGEALTEYAIERVRQALGLDPAEELTVSGSDDLINMLTDVNLQTIPDLAEQAPYPDLRAAVLTQHALADHFGGLRLVAGDRPAAGYLGFHLILLAAWRAAEMAPPGPDSTTQ
jgi:hypothetical protein